ncbi:MAG: hypothetical protein QF682_08015 [Candidatus Thermoplasmatota archaeon]|jgi:hypothetical protein|nr:hypothetical protein [Candidatus Thermoplasmatota archaeon]
MKKIISGNKKYPTTFRTAVWVSAKDLSIITREVLNELDFKFERNRSTKNYSKLIIVVPVPSFSYVFRFDVNEPVQFTIKIYDEKPTPSAEVHFIEIETLSLNNLQQVKKFVQCLASKLPRKPWKFSFSDRFRYAFAAPEYVSAKKKWRMMGVE